MSAEERLQAVEQMVAAMQMEVVQARAAAAQAEQRATDAETRVLGARTEGFVDTRLLWEPKSFDGATDNWRQFKFTFLAYAGAVDARRKRAMIESDSDARSSNHELSLASQRSTGFNTAGITW